ncbi:MAG TPA: hypothetical protein PKI19_05080 [Elusimicrobiales bacterium]|nr:hypothetical protein [Elusimicrobiales bacterium]
MNANKLLLPACCAALLAACAASGPGSGPGPEQKKLPAGPGAAVVFEKRVFKLSKNPNPALEAALGDYLTAGYQAAVKNLSGEKPGEIGFTYSLAPKGATYPFSEIEVSCIMQEKYARGNGPALCGDFFQELDRQLQGALKKK